MNGMQMVGAYPFERPEDKNDPAKLQKMIQVCLGNIMHWCFQKIWYILQEPFRLEVMPTFGILIA